MKIEAVEKLRAELPAIFYAVRLDELTADAICWGTIQNKRCQRDEQGRPVIPAECFLYSGRKVLVDRDLFLDWWAGTLSVA